MKRTPAVFSRLILAATRGLTVSGTAKPAIAAATMEMEVEDVYDPVAPGGFVYRRVHYRNVGDAPASGVFVSAVYGQGFLYDESEPPPNDVQRNSWTIGSVPAGGSGFIAIAGMTSPDVADGFVIQSTMRLTDDQGTDLSQDVDTTVREPSLAISAAAERDPVAPGGSARYTVTYTNEGAYPATFVRVYGDLDPRLQIRSTSVVPDDDFQNRWTFRNLEPGASGSIVIDLDVDAAVSPGEQLASTFTVRIGNRSWDTVLRGAVALPQPSVEISHLATRVAPGGQLTFQVSYANDSGAALYNAEVDAGFEEGLTIVSATPPAIDGTTNRWGVGTLAPGASGLITVVAAVAADAPYGARLAGRAALRGTVNISGALPAVEAEDTSRAAMVASCGLTIASSFKSSPLPGDQMAGTTQVCDACTDHENMLVEMGFDSGLDIMKYSPTSRVVREGASLTQFVPSLPQGTVLAITYLTEVDPTMPSGTAPQSLTTVSDAAGMQMTEETTFHVRGYDAPVVRLSAARRSRVGKNLTIKARYMDVTPVMTLRITLRPKCRSTRCSRSRPRPKAPAWSSPG